MGKYKEHPKYNILSIRVTNQQKALLDEMKRCTQKSTSMLMSEAMHLYFTHGESVAGWER